MKGDPEQRALLLGEYIVEHGATVRAAARAFGCSKSKSGKPTQFLYDTKTIFMLCIIGKTYCRSTKIDLSKPLFYFINSPAVFCDCLGTGTKFFSKRDWNRIHPLGSS